VGQALKVNGIWRGGAAVWAPAEKRAATEGVSESVAGFIADWLNTGVGEDEEDEDEDGVGVVAIETGEDAVGVEEAVALLTPDWRESWR
jgi:hypothetical protein